MLAGSSILQGFGALDLALLANPLTEVAALSPSYPTTGLVFADAVLFSSIWTGLELVGVDATPTGGANLWVVAAQPAVVANAVTLVSGVGVGILEALDPLLLVGEVALVGLFIGGGLRVGLRAWGASVGYADLVAFCQARSVSLAEVFSLVTFAVGFVLFDAFVTLAEDDVLEGVSLVFVSIIGLAVILLGLAVDVQYFYMISSISGGELTLRIVYADLVNNALCLLRVFFCWVRYLFYDLQSELVDLSFHYTELVEEGVVGMGSTIVGGGLGWSGWVGLTGFFLVGYLDGVALVVQLLVGAFKLALALFLFWLILDLFLLRTLARSELCWVGVSRRA